MAEGRPPRSVRTGVLPALFGLTLLITLLVRIRPAPVLDAITALRLGPLAVAVGLLLLSRLGLQIDRWRRTLRALGCELGMVESLRLGIAAFALQLGTPGKTGAVLVAGWLERRHRLPVAEGLSSMALPSLHTIWVLALLAPLGKGLWEGGIVQRTTTELAAQPVQAASLVAATLAVIGVLVVLAASASRRAGPRAWLAGLAAVFTRIPVRVQAGLALYSAAGVLLEIEAVSWLFRAGGVSLPHHALVGGIACVLFAANLPISLGGFGTREAATMVVFSTAAPPDTLLAIGLVWSSLGYLVFVLGGLPAVLTLGLLPTAQRPHAPGALGDHGGNP